jgi:N-acetylmuramate 1-kinase
MSFVVSSGRDLASDKNVQKFLKRAHFTPDDLDVFSADWSSRSFARVTSKGRTAILMLSYPDEDPRSLAGHKMRDYVEKAGFLKGISIAVPEIYAVDFAHGFMLVEDFGTKSLHDIVVSEPNRSQDLYLQATDILIDLAKKTQNNSFGTAQDFFDSHVYCGTRRLCDWYLPIRIGKNNDHNISNDFMSGVEAVRLSLPHPLTSFAHMDFHPFNIMVRADGSFGLIDFQAGLVAPVPYDLVNLLVDIRRDVPQEIQQSCTQKFLKAFSGDERERILLWQDFLSFCFHARIMGQAIKLAFAGKKSLLEFLPRVHRQLRTDLSKPIFSDFKKLLLSYGLDFDQDFLPIPNGNDCKSFIAEDAI